MTSASYSDCEAGSQVMDLQRSGENRLSGQKTIKRSIAFAFSASLLIGFYVFGPLANHVKVGSEVKGNMIGALAKAFVPTQPLPRPSDQQIRGASSKMLHEPAELEREIRRIDTDRNKIDIELKRLQFQIEQLHVKPANADRNVKPSFSGSQYTHLMLGFASFGAAILFTRIALAIRKTLKAGQETAETQPQIAFTRQTPLMPQVHAQPQVPRLAQVCMSAPISETEDTAVASATKKEELIPNEPELQEYLTNPAFAMSKSLSRKILLSKTMEPEPLPAVWDKIWEVDFLKAGERGEPLTFGDVARTFKVNIEQIFAGKPAPDNAPLAAADLEGLDFKALFLGMKTYFDQYGSVFKMCFGPKSFLVVTDPMVTKHILVKNARNYDKGALALVLEDIMGKGLIPADRATWNKRRRAIQPGFHKLYLERMIHEFGAANLALIPRLKEAISNDTKLDMEERFGSLALDIIGKAVFNYEFGSVDEESPVVKAAIRTLGEVEHRALTPLPYWKIPGANELIPRLQEFQADMDLLNTVLYKLIDQCLDSRDPQELEALQAKDYDKVKDPSLLRFLVDLRGEEVDNKQMRDDLITLLIAGHETTAATLTWATYALWKHPETLKRLQAEIDEKVGDRIPTIEDVESCRVLQNVIAETLRMWPAPPLLIRCALEEDQWPEGGTGIEGGVKINRANDLFISMYNMGRSPQLWDKPDVFDIDRWERKFVNFEVKGWQGYDPEKRNGLYPSEMATDFAFIPFGGGERKCVGDKFALLETAVTMIMLYRRFEFDIDMAPVNPQVLASTPEGEDDSIGYVGMKAAATIHTATGLWCKLRERQLPQS